MLWLTTAASVEVQPLEGSVTVRVYVPSASTTADALELPDTILPLLVVQANVAPVVLDEPLKVTVGEAQV